MKSKSLVSLGLIAVLQLTVASVVEEHCAYDAIGRLTEVTDGNGVAVESYRYDGVSNIVEKVLDGETYRLSYDAAYQIKSVDGPAGLLEFTYDKAGRMITETLNGRTVAEYTWGYFDKVIEVKRNGKVTRFDYDGQGMLVGKELPDGTYERWVWDGMALIARGDEYYVNEPHITGGLPIVSKTKEGVLYHQYDPLGTTLASYTADGKLAATYKATVFGKGEELQNSPAARFTGKPYDADLGAYVFPFRNYKPELARWMSADPSGFPDGSNNHFYAPVPTSEVDPLGLYNVPHISPPFTHSGAWTTAQYFDHYFNGRDPYAKGETVNLEVTGNLPDIRSSGVSSKALSDMKEELAEKINKRWSKMLLESGSSSRFFNVTDTFRKDGGYNYEFVLYALGDTRLLIDYNVNVTPLDEDLSPWNYSLWWGHDGTHWKYSGTATFKIDDRFEDVVDVPNWIDKPHLEFPGGKTFGIVGTWQVDISDFER